MDLTNRWRPTRLGNVCDEPVIRIACLSNWDVSVDVERREKADEQLRKILGAPDNEEIIMIIAAGYPQEEFSYVTSVRNPLEESLAIVN